MKKIACFVVLMWIIMPIFSQNLFDIRIKSDELNSLKTTSTVFVLPISTAEGINEDLRNIYKKQIAEVWKITPIEVIALSEKKGFDPIKYSFFEVWEWGSKENNQSTGVGFDFKLTCATMVKSKEKPISIGLIKFPYFLQPCWTLAPGILKSLLKVFNDELEIASAKKSHEFFGDVEDLADLSNLKTETLYIPEAVFDKQGKKGWLVEKPSSEKLNSVYPNPYKIVTVSELSDLIIRGEVTYFLIDFNDGGYRRFNVVNAKTGKMISGRISANADILGTESTAYNLSYYQKLNKKIQKG